MAYPDIYPGAKYVGSPNFTPGRQGFGPEAVIWHIADGTLAGMDSWFNNPASQVSATFGIGDGTDGFADGEIHQYTYISNTAWANGKIEAGYTAALIDENGGVNPNVWSVPIEFAGKGGSLPTPKQTAAGVALTAWLFTDVLLKSGASGVAVDRKHILRHSEISPVTRSNCPGWPEPVLAMMVEAVKARVEGVDIKTYEQGVKDGIAKAVAAANAAWSGLQ